MVAKIKEDFGAGKDLIICVIAAIGQEKVIAYREANK
jgi:hypothetical protein